VRTFRLRHLCNGANIVFGCHLHVMEEEAVIAKVLCLAIDKGGASVRADGRFRGFGTRL
jgi:hypothetical protein